MAMGEEKPFGGFEWAEVQSTPIIWHFEQRKKKETKKARALNFERWSINNLIGKIFHQSFEPSCWNCGAYERYNSLFFFVSLLGRSTLNSFPPYDLWWPQECGEISDTSVLTFFFISRHYIILISIHFFNNISCVFLSRGHKREWPHKSRLVWQ